MSNDQSPKKEVYRSQTFADFKPELSAPGATPERLAHLREHGFVIINDFVDNPWIPNPPRGRQTGYTSVRTRKRLRCHRLLKGICSPGR